MSEYIKREDAIKALHDEPVRYIKAICDIPSADVVEVVRCKECIYNDRGWCGAQEYGTRYIEDDDYCSYGERKDDND